MECGRAKLGFAAGEISYSIYVGSSSSRDLPLAGTLTVG